MITPKYAAIAAAIVIATATALWIGHGLVNSIDESSGKKTGPEETAQATRRLLTRPSLEEAENRMRGAVQQIGAVGTELIPGLQWSWKRDRTINGCPPPYDQTDGRIVYLPFHVSDLPVPRRRVAPLRGTQSSDSGRRHRATGVDAGQAGPSRHVVQQPRRRHDDPDQQPSSRRHRGNGRLPSAPGDADTANHRPAPHVVITAHRQPCTDHPASPHRPALDSRSAATSSDPGPQRDCPPAHSHSLTSSSATHCATPTGYGAGKPSTTCSNPAATASPIAARVLSGRS